MTNKGDAGLQGLRLYHGNCLEEMKHIVDGSVDMILADPPYGTTACKWDSVIPFDAMWERLNKLIKPNGAVVLFGSEPFSSALRMSNIKNYKYDWTWKKSQATGTMLAKKQPMRIIENILVFYKKQATYNPKMIERTEKELKRLSHKSVYSSLTEIDNRKYNKTPNRYDYKYKYPNNLIDIKSVCNRHKGKYSHPTQKPVALMEYLIKTYTNENETVLDFTMGSGTTGVACANLNRDFIGIELDLEYFKIAEKRINENI